MKKQTKYGLISAAFVALALFVGTEMAHATGKKHDESIDINAEQNQGQEQSQTATADAVSDAVSDASSTSSSSNDGNTMTVEGDSVENNSSNVVLVPNNNTESCVRVFGLAFGKNGESGAIGWPWRSRACDFEQAADDAFAAGERDLGWFWKCQNKNVARPFKLEGMSWDDAKLKCHETARGAQGHERTIELLKSQVEAANNRAKAAEDLAELARAHETVCEESKERCEQKLYGGK